MSAWSLRSRLVAVAALVGAATIVIGWRLSAPDAAPAAPQIAVPASVEIVARGRIEPVGRVRAIHGPAEGAVVQDLSVEQGQRVRAGDILAVLDGYAIRAAELAVAERGVDLAETQRDQTRAGAKHSEIAAQRNVLAAKQARRDMLDREWKRRRALFGEGHASQQSLDSAAADRTTADNEVEQARNALKALTETRGVDDRVAQARAAVERAGVDKARAELEHLVIRAPIDGVVLSVQARAGEMIGQDGLLRLAALDRLVVVAEVEESQASLLREGMAALIEAPLLERPVRGRVSRLSHEVFREKRPASDVLTGRDARIVEVDITPETALPPVVGAEMRVRLSPAPASGDAR